MAHLSQRPCSGNTLGKRVCSEMKENKHPCFLQLDPRTKILLLLVSNLLLFLGSTAEIVYIYMAVLAMVLLLSGCYKSVLAFCMIGTVLVSLNYFIFPIAPEAFTMLFSISVNYTFKMLPCLMAGSLIILTTSLHDVVLTMRKCHLPQKLIISLSVTIRYFPAIFEEVKHIHNAMKLRTIPPSEKMECFVVPFMMAASTTVEELSAAAVTRGIENPAKKTSVTQLRFHFIDYIVLLTEAGFIIAAFVIK